MQNDDAMRRARECFGRNLEWYDGDPREDVVPAFARAIREAVAEEREACANVETGVEMNETEKDGAWAVRAAIRARGET